MPKFTGLKPTSEALAEAEALGVSDEPTPAEISEALLPSTVTSTEVGFARRLMKEELARVAQFLIEDPIYLENFIRRLRGGKLHPTLESMVWAYAHGKPKERIEVRKASVVKIIHEFASEAPTVDGEVVAAPEEGEANG